MKKYWKIIVIAFILVLGISYISFGVILHQKLSNIEGKCEAYLDVRPDNFADKEGFWKNKDFDPTKYRMSEYETVRFSSREEGIEIAGFYIPGQKEKPVVIVVHGFNSCKHKTSVLVPAGMLNKAGFHVLVIDVRDTGESTLEDGLSALGNEEYLDVLGAWDWLQVEKGFSPQQIGVMGNSMGAATSLIAFAQEPKLAAVFVDAPYENLTQITREELDRNGYPQFLFYSGWIAGLLQGDNLLSFNPYEAIINAGNRPLFIIHSKADTRVGIQHTYQLRERAEKEKVDATFWILEDIEHVQTAGAFPEEYTKKITSFFETNLE